MARLKWTEQAPGISVFRAGGADEFLDILRRSKEHWWEGNQIPGVFRGHADESWPLLPSAWRPDNPIIAASRTEATQRFERVKPAQRLHWSFANNHVTGQARFGDNDRDLQRKLTIEATAELLPVYDFLLLSDRLGLSTPMLNLPADPTLDPDWLIGQSDPLVGDDFFRFTDLPHYIALAQHHGLPTRLLDWTHDPINAAFFAVEATGNEPQADIAVWAIHRRRAMFVEGKPGIFPEIYDAKPDEGKTYKKSAGIEIVRTPMHENFFLAAQSGQFTSIRRSGIDFMHRGGVRPSLETFVAEVGPKEPVLRKMILPRSCVPELAVLLEREEVSRSRLMPTHDNVAAEVRRKWTLSRGQTA